MTEAAMTRTGAQRRIVVIANETCVGRNLFEEVRERRGTEDSEVILIAPALTSRLRYWLSDEDGGIAEAEARAAESAERCGAAGIPVRAYVGDPDPLQALDDAVRLYQPDEVLVATHPPDRANWLEEGFASQARARFALPITHVVVDRESATSTVEPSEPGRRNAPAVERHRRRDVAILVIAAFLAIAGTLLSLVFFGADVPTWFLWTWVLVLDLGLKIVLAITVWVLFQRRPRSDRLDF